MFSAANANNGLTSGFEFLRTDFSPRTTAMSTAHLGLRGDLNTMFINPAGMAYLKNQQYGFNYTNYLLDISGGFAGYARPVEKLGLLTVGLIYMDYGSFDETNEYAEITGETFSANELALGVGVANRLDKHFVYGVNLKYAFSKISQYNASAVAIDFGLSYSAPFMEDLYFSFVLRNLGYNFEYYNNTEETLPLSLSMGFNKKLAHLPLDIGASVKDLNVQTDPFWERILRFSVGGEFTMSEALRLRLGYDHDVHSGLDLENETTGKKFGGLAGGLGIYWKDYRFDYAYSNYGGLGNVHRFGIRGTL